MSYRVEGKDVPGRIAELEREVRALQRQIAAGSSLYASVNTVVGDYTVTENDDFVQSTGTGATIMLPSAVGIRGRRYTIDNTDSAAINLSAMAPETINDIPDQQITANSSMSVYSDGAAWRIVT